VGEHKKSATVPSIGIVVKALGKTEIQGRRFEQSEKRQSR
jgi:hypothetical protein